MSDALSSMKRWQLMQSEGEPAPYLSLACASACRMPDWVAWQGTQRSGLGWSNPAFLVGAARLWQLSQARCFSPT